MKRHKYIIKHKHDAEYITNQLKMDDWLRSTMITVVFTEMSFNP